MSADESYAPGSIIPACIWIRIPSLFGKNLAQASRVRASVSRFSLVRALTGPATSNPNKVCSLCQIWELAQDVGAPTTAIIKGKRLNLRSRNDFSNLLNFHKLKNRTNLAVHIEETKPCFPARLLLHQSVDGHKFCNPERIEVFYIAKINLHCLNVPFQPRARLECIEQMVAPVQTRIHGAQD